MGFLSRFGKKKQAETELEPYETSRVKMFVKDCGRLTQILEERLDYIDQGEFTKAGISIGDDVEANKESVARFRGAANEVIATVATLKQSAQPLLAQKGDMKSLDDSQLSNLEEMLTLIPEAAEKIKECGPHFDFKPRALTVAETYQPEYQVQLPLGTVTCMGTLIAEDASDELNRRKLNEAVNETTKFRDAEDARKSAPQQDGPAR